MGVFTPAHYGDVTTLCIHLTGLTSLTQRKPFSENILTAVVDKTVKMIYGLTKVTVTVGQNVVSKYNPPLFCLL